MDQNIGIVIIDSDPDSIKNIQKYVAALGDHAVVVGVAQTFERGYEIIFKKRPMVVVMEIDELEDSIRRMSEILERFPSISVFATSSDKSPDTILRVMRAGATEYILRPVSEVDLSSALQKVGRLWITKPSPAEAETGRIITVFSPKGGVGVTTIAISLATDIYDITNKSTILVDMDLNAGDVTTFLNLKTTYTISDVTTNITKLDKSFLTGVMAKHESGIYVLAEPQKIEEGTAITAADLRKVLGLLRTMFKYIIVDTESVLDERTRAAIDLSDEVLLIFCLSLPGIKGTNRYLSYLEKIGYRDKLKLVVNRHLKKGDIKIEDAERILKHPVFWSIPNDYNTAMECLNKGVPLRTGAPRSDLNFAIREMAKSLVTTKK